MQGSVVIGLCVIAVALTGFMMLRGSLPLRQGASVVVGCFVLLSAPVIADGLRAAAGGEISTRSEPAVLPPETPLPPPPPPSDYDPYAGASLRHDRSRE